MARACFVCIPNDRPNAVKNFTSQLVQSDDLRFFTLPEVANYRLLTSLSRTVMSAHSRKSGQSPQLWAGLSHMEYSDSFSSTSMVCMPKQNFEYSTFDSVSFPSRCCLQSSAPTKVARQASEMTLGFPYAIALQLWARGWLMSAPQLMAFQTTPCLLMVLNQTASTPQPDASQ
jgi:hypothetical protein